MAEGGTVIVMGTLNGGRWLRAQLESIRDQWYRDWQLLISDDGSTDQSLAVIEQFAGLDDRITVLPRRGGAQGHVGNFEYLLLAAKTRGASVVFLADQDDVWNAEKLKVQLADLAFALASFSDLEVVRSDGSERGSYLRLMGLAPPESVASLISQNSVVGCSMAVRAEVLQLALPFPPHLENHDWWLALCAMVRGRLGFNAKRLVCYRQHRDNVIGSRNLFRQARKAREIIGRQQRVLDSKVYAVRELQRRLRELDQPVPAELGSYLDAFGNGGRIARCKGLLSREFRPASSLLLGVQLLSQLLRQDNG